MIPILIILALIVVLDASGDGFRARGKQWPHHIAEALVLIVFYGTLWIYSTFTHHELIWIGIFYLSARIIFFNPIINKVRNKPWDYVSDNNLWDKIPWKWRNRITLLAYVGLIISFVMIIK